VAIQSGRTVQQLQSPTGEATTESAPSLIGPIILDVKQAGKPGAGKRHAGFDEAGAGDGAERPPRQSSTLLMWQGVETRSEK